MKAKLVVFRDPSTLPSILLGSGSPAAIESDALRSYDEVSCATCKWAASGIGEREILGRDTPAMTCIRGHAGGALLGIDSASHGYSGIIVSPDFGCTQWEGK